MRGIRFLFSATLVLMLCACATNPMPQEKKIIADEKNIIETDERLVQGCYYLGSVNGATNFGKTFSFYATWLCKKDARRQAAISGATHIVWLYTHPTAASALAYDCNKQRQVQVNP
jgi:hypothetical protein